MPSFSLSIAIPATRLRPLVVALFGIIALTVAAKIRVPFWPVPMTLQTLVVLLIGSAFGARLAAATVASYLLAGSFGLPVFANAAAIAGGVIYLTGPTAGFLFAMPFAAWIVGHSAERAAPRSYLNLLGPIAAATGLILLSGWTWLAFAAHLPGGANGVGPASAFAVGIEPFVVGEVLKASLALALSGRFGDQARAWTSGR